MAAAGATAATGVPGPVAPAAAAGTACSASAAPGSQGVLIGDRLYSGVLITLENCLLPDDKLRFTPSMSSGLDTDTETDLRVVGCELIQAAGILLRLPQVRARPRPRAEITAAPARGWRPGPLLAAGRAQRRPPVLTASGAQAPRFAATGPPRVGPVRGASVGVYDVSVSESHETRGLSCEALGLCVWKRWNPFSVLGGYGDRAGAVPALLLHQVLREAFHGGKGLLPRSCPQKHIERNRGQLVLPGRSEEQGSVPFRARALHLSGREAPCP